MSNKSKGYFKKTKRTAIIQRSEVMEIYSFLSLQCWRAKTILVRIFAKLWKYNKSQQSDDQQIPANHPQVWIRGEQVEVVSSKCHGCRQNPNKEPG